MTEPMSDQQQTCADLVIQTLNYSDISDMDKMTVCCGVVIHYFLNVSNDMVILDRIFKSMAEVAKKRLETRKDAVDK
jgi:hypothetical protein